MAPGTSITSSPASRPIPRTRSTAPTTAPLSPKCSRNGEIFGAVPSPQNHALVPGRHALQHLVRALLERGELGRRRALAGHAGLLAGQMPGDRLVEDVVRRRARHDRAAAPHEEVPVARRRRGTRRRRRPARPAAPRYTAWPRRWRCGRRCCPSSRRPGSSRGSAGRRRRPGRARRRWRPPRAGCARWRAAAGSYRRTARLATSLPGGMPSGTVHARPQVPPRASESMTGVLGGLQRRLAAERRLWLVGHAVGDEEHALAHQVLPVESAGPVMRPASLTPSRPAP